MMVLPPVAAAQAGQATGGGLLDSIKGAFSGGAAPSTQAAPAGDGSVGLFDGVLKKAFLGGAVGAAIGFIPVIPGGPILGGILGAVGGAAMGAFSNWRKMQAIKAENQAMIAALGVQANDPAVQQILQSGNVQQLIPLVQQQGGVPQQGTPGQGTPGQGTPQQGTTQQSPNIKQLTDPATGITQTIDVSTGRVVDPTGATTGLPAGTAPNQSPVPTQGATAPSAVVPGVAPSALAQGGGGSAGDVGRPAPPAGTNSADVSAIAPVQADIGTHSQAVATAATGVDTLTLDTSKLDRTQMLALLQRLQQQVEQLTAFLAEQERIDQLDKAAAR